MMVDVGIVGFSQSTMLACEPEKTDAEMLSPVITEVLDGCGLKRQDVDFVVSGSTDYLSGIPFSFVHALDAIGVWPPVAESHVEMDAAWAFYEAWVKIQTGGAKIALVYGFGKSSTPNDLDQVMAMQLDPYHLVPLGIKPSSLAALQARILLESGRATMEDMALVAQRNLYQGQSNPWSLRSGNFSLDALLNAPKIAEPLSEFDCAPVTDGVAAMVVATKDVAEQLVERPVWVRGIDHRIDPPAMGVRDLSDAPSARLACEKAGAHCDKLDVAEIYAPYSHQELILREVMGLASVEKLNPSGGVLCGHPIMSAGLIRIGEVFRYITEGKGDRGLGHATSGSCLQQNLVVTLEGKHG
ncbi:MAG: lipid-transfer protein [Myxococcota bacterium]|nr:lipid-transfer protein [Myxococcota bacterium]